MPILIILAYIGGFCRLYGTFECFSNILPKITPTYNYGVFLSFVFFVVIGCVQLFDFAAIKIIHYYDWQHVHILAIGLCLSVIALALVTMRHFRPQPKTPLVLFLCFDILLSTQTVLQNSFMGGVLHWGQDTEAQLKIPEFLGGLVAALFFWFTRTYLHWRLKFHVLLSMSATVLYCLVMTFVLSDSAGMRQLYLPSAIIGFAHVAIFITLTVYAQAYCNFKYYFQVLCILGFVRMGLGEALGAAIWKHALSATTQLGHLSFVGSLRELYGWAVAFGVMVLILILCCTFDRLRNPFPTIKQAYMILTNTIQKMKIPALIIVLTLTMGVRVEAQTYTLEDLFSIADSTAKAIKISQSALGAAEEAVAGAKSQLLPQIGVQLSVGYNGDGLITDRDFSNPMTVPIPHFANSFSLQASQVIFAGGAISGGIELGEMGQQMAELDVEKNRQEVRFHIAGQYLDMMKTLNTIKVLDKNIELTGHLIDEMQSRVEQGAALPNEVTRYELQLETLKLQRRRLQDAYSVMNYDLCQTLSLPEGTKVVPEVAGCMEVAGCTEVCTEVAGGCCTEVAGFDGAGCCTEVSGGGCMDMELGEWSVDGNFGLQQAALAGMMAEKKVSVAKAGMLPQIAIVAENHLDGPVTIEIPALDNNFNYWFVGVGLKYDISSLYRGRHDVRRAKAEQAKAAAELAHAREQLETALHAAQAELQTARAELQTNEKQVRLASDNYDLVSKRYLAGLALTSDMLDAFSMKLSAEISREQSKINILYCQTILQYLAGRL